MVIFFDIDGTLVDHCSAERRAAIAFQKEYANLFPEPKSEFVAMWRSLVEKHISRYLAGEISFQEQRRARLRELFARSRWEPSDEEADALFQVYLTSYEDNWRLFPDVGECLENLRNHSLGIISNGDSAQQRQKLQRLGIYDKFSLVLISGDIGISKPEQGIFLEACRRVGEPPHLCAYVGDDLETDALASSAAGFLGIWINRSRAVATTSEIPTIASLAELRKVIESHR